MMKAFLASVLPLLAATDVRGCSFTPPTSTPPNASDYLNPNFFGYHYETASWVNWALDNEGEINQFSRNMYKATTDRTGGVPIIRLGGTDTDYTLFEPGQLDPCLPYFSRQFQGRSFNLTLGPSYWDLCKNFDDLGAKYIIQVPVGRLNLTEALVWTNTSHQTMGDRIIAYEIGNEDNDFPVRFKGPGFIGKVDNQSYIDLWLNTSQPMAEALGYQDGERFLQAFDTAMVPYQQTPYVYPVPQLFEDGLDQHKHIKYVSHHWYPSDINGPEDLQRLLFNHSIIPETLFWLPPWLDFLKTAADGDKIPFIWSEVSSGLGNYPGFQNTFGSALWNVDFFLYSMSIGVDSIHYSENFGVWFLLWLPIYSDGIQAQTFADFYSFPLMADFIGNSTKSQAAILDYDAGTENSNIIAYAAYEDDQPKRIALINFDFWGNFEYNGTQTSPVTGGGTTTLNITAALPGNGTRATTPVTINVPDWCKSVKVNRMSSDLGAYALADNITYGGSQWTAASQGMEVYDVVQDGETLTSSNGSVVVNLLATSAALLFLQ